MSEEKILINGYNCNISFGRYFNGRTAMKLILIDTGELYAIATVNIPEEQLNDDEVFIKNYSENEGVLEALEKAGIVKNTGRYVKPFFVEIPICKLIKKESEIKDAHMS